MSFGIPGHDEWKTTPPVEHEEPPSHCDSCRDLIDPDDPHLCKCEAGPACQPCPCTDCKVCGAWGCLGSVGEKCQIQTAGGEVAGDE